MAYFLQNEQGISISTTLFEGARLMEASVVDTLLEEFEERQKERAEQFGAASLANYENAKSAARNPLVMAVENAGTIAELRAAMLVLQEFDSRTFILPDPGVEDGTTTSPFTSTSQVPTLTDGNYWFSLGGSLAELHVEGGWILIRSAEGNTSQPLIEDGSVILPADNGQYGQAVTQGIAAIASGVRITGQGEEILSTTGVPVDRIRNYLPLDNQDDRYVAAADWDETGAATSRLNYTCTPSSGGGAGATFQDRVYHACGNTNGVHWFDGNNSYVGVGTPEPMQLWVR